MSDYARFKKDHPEMLKMAEDHLEELEQMAEKLNQAIALLREHPPPEKMTNPELGTWSVEFMEWWSRCRKYLDGEGDGQPTDVLLALDERERHLDGEGDGKDG